MAKTKKEETAMPTSTKKTWGVVGVNRNKLAEELSKMSATGATSFSIQFNKDMIGSYDVIYFVEE